MTIDPSMVLAGDLTTWARRFMTSLLVFFTRLPWADREAILKGIGLASQVFADVHGALLEQENEERAAEKRTRARRKRRE